MKKLSAIFVLMFAVSAFAAGVPSLTGRWKIHNSVAGSESDQECTLVQTGNKITGSCKSQDGKDLVVTGSLDGKKATWKYDSDFNGNPLTMTYTATLDDSGRVAGSVQVDPFGVSGDFTATPVKETAK